MRSFVRLFLASAVLVLAAAELAAPAIAATCVLAAPTVTLTVGDAETARIVRVGDEITLDGAAGSCGGATVSTIDTISLTSTGAPTEVAIDLGGGVFAPGLTDEGDGGSEIEITVTVSGGRLRISGTAGDDDVVIGQSGVNLNAAEATGDPDVTITGVSELVVEGAGGGDSLSVAGGAGAGAAGPVAIIRGQAGDDVLVGAVGGSTLDGGDGVDTADYAGATRVAADLTAGTAGHEGGAIDALVAIENLIGSPGDDDITGNASANVLAGGVGDDTVDGAGEADTLVGGEGDDTASFASSARGVTVDLGEGTAEGDGNDTLDGFENVVGSGKGDAIRGNKGPNDLDGAGGKDEVSGGNGTDDVLGGDGNDLLFGGNGNDLLKGGNGKDQLNGGRGTHDICKGGADPDSFVFCENFPT
jgi:Ca2+-binding RTX toxin-like protein